MTALARAHGSEGWAAECDAAFARLPLACFVAVARATRRPRARPRRCSASPATTPPAGASSVPSWSTPIGASAGIGRALLLAALHAMRAEGYAYAIIGWASSVEFYRKAVGATVIEGSEPGIYPAAARGPSASGPRHR